MFYKLMAAIWLAFSLWEMFNQGHTDRAMYAALVAILNYLAAIELNLKDKNDTAH